jgi:mono/diheme cytochrome c family protein
MSSKTRWCLVGAACATLLALLVPLALGATQRSTQATPGNYASGKQVFISFCGKCHTLAAVGSRGVLGPNLDQDRVTYSAVISAVQQGVGGIQAEYILRFVKFPQIQDVAKFVVTASDCAKPGAHCQNSSESS